MRIKAVFFDLDGCLWDSKQDHYEALNRALKPYGYTITKEEQLTTYEGLPTKTKLKMLTANKGLPEHLHEAISLLKQQYTAELMQELKPRVQQKRLMEKLKAQGLKIGLCSNSIRSTVEVFLDKSELREYFDFTYSNEDVKRAKPDPEMYQNAIAALELKPEEVLILEDSPYGLMAARSSAAKVLEVKNVGEVNTHFVLGALE